MPLPDKEKDWVTDPNNSIPFTTNILTTNRTWILALVNALLSLTANHNGVSLTCSGSGNSVAGAMDGSNRWLTIANLVWANGGVAHSWIVLRAPGWCSPAGGQICISLENAAANGTSILIGISQGALYTGGSATARPTATDEVLIAPAATANGGRSAGTDGVVFHIIQTDDGANLRVLICTNGEMSGFLALETPVDAVTGWTTPNAAIFLGAASGTACATAATIYDAAAFHSRNAAANGTMDIYLAAEGFNNAAGWELISVANAFSGEWEMWPCAFDSVTGGSAGRHGRAVDIWYGSIGANDNDYYPADATRQFIQAGCLILPWDGSLALMAA